MSYRPTAKTILMEWVRRADGSVAHSVVVDGASVAAMRTLLRRDADLASRYELRTGPTNPPG